MAHNTNKQTNKQRDHAGGLTSRSTPRGERLWGAERSTCRLDVSSLETKWEERFLLLQPAGHMCASLSFYKHEERPRYRRYVDTHM